MFVLQKLALITASGLLLAACGSGGSGSDSQSLSSRSDSSASNSIESSSSSEQNTESSSLSSVTSVSSTSSSEGVSASNTVAYLFPTKAAHLGGVPSTELQIKLRGSPVVGAAVTEIVIGDVVMEQREGSDIWLSTSPLVLGATDDQSFEVALNFDNGSTLAVDPLTLHNQGSGLVTKAGSTRVHSPRSLTFDPMTEDLYFSQPFFAEVLRVDADHGLVDVVYQGEQSEFSNKDVYWPLAADGETGTIYFVEDVFSYDNAIGSEKHTLTLHAYQPSSSLMQSYESHSRMRAAVAAHLNNDDSFPGAMYSKDDSPAQPYTTLFILDSLTSTALQRWVVEGERAGASDRILIGEKTAEGRLFVENDLSAITYDSDRKVYYVAKRFDDENNMGYSAIVEVTAELDGTDVIAESDLWLSTPSIKKPTAMLMSRDASSIYIADNNRIWEAEKTSPPTLKLISSNSFDEVIGSGVDFGGMISGMALHPTLDVIYVAAGSGIIAVDLKTGNRIGVLR